MSASVIYGYDSFKSGTSLADLLMGRWSSAGYNAISAPTLNATGGRFGGQSWRYSWSNQSGLRAFLSKGGLSNLSTMVLHFSARVSALPTHVIELASFLDVNALQVSVVLNADGTLSIYRGGSGGTLLATSSSAISAGMYYTYELKVTFATGTGGTIELRVWGPGFPSSGAAIASTSSLNTSASTNAYANGYNCGSVTNSNQEASYATIDYEHFLACDDFLGDKRFYAGLPTACTTAVWTPNTGTNLSRVNETQEDGDTSYVSSSNPGDIDYYTFPALPAGVQNIFAVIASIWHRKDDAGARQVRTKKKQGSTVVSGATVNPSTSYAEQWDASYVDPVTTIPFVASDVNSLNLGFEEVA